MTYTIIAVLFSLCMISNLVCRSEWIERQNPKVIFFFVACMYIPGIIGAIFLIPLLLVQLTFNWLSKLWTAKVSSIGFEKTQL